MVRTVFVATLILVSTVLFGQDDGNRLTYLDANCDPYYPSLSFAKLTTPQWVGEEGVEAVVTLGIDDMRAVGPYESYLRPILERLKQIDSRAPVSIMTNSIDPGDPQLQKWLHEGLSIETHTADHPCPCLQGGDFARAKSTYDRCVEQVFAISGNDPVTFRFPCMDSMNTPSPRAFAEIINRTTPEGKFLQSSSSVVVLLTANDPSLPSDLLWDEDGRSRFGKYIPFPSFVNKIEDYPYPYIIGQLCWEFPVAVPDDWQGQNLHGSGNPKTAADIKAVVDATILKQGMANLTFHPGGWIRSEQLVSVVDHIAKTYGDKVKFLNFHECVERINKHLLLGQSLRDAKGGDNGVRLLDVNADGYLDVCIGNDSMRKTRIWLPKDREWLDTEFPTRIVWHDERGESHPTGVRFGVVRSDRHASIIVGNEAVGGGWHFDGEQWIEAPELIRGLKVDGQPLETVREGRDTGVRLRDIDKDGYCELIAGGPHHQSVWRWTGAAKANHELPWQRASFALPSGTMIVDAHGRDAGLRFVDLDEDGDDDVIFSNEVNASIHLYVSAEEGWTRSIQPAEHKTARSIPMISRAGTNNGAWFAARHMWLQNENTNRLADGVQRRSFVDLLGDYQPRPKAPEVALKSIRVGDGFRVELVAAEPLVRDPIAFDWGPDGKLWVVEMADYPLGLGNKGTPGGRIRYLEDTDDDGQYDKSTLFMDQIPFPTGVTPWRNGVLVSAAPEIFFAADNDGDGRADERETLYRGFAEGNQQHRVNGFAWGLDNWIHVANGDSGGTVESIKTGKRVDISGRDLRIRPDTGEIDPQTGQTQFGRRRDDWGNWFSCTNSIPMRHVVLADHYLRRNRHYAPATPLRDLAHTSSTRVFPISQVLSHWEGYRPPSADEDHRFTSASGTSVYRDDIFGRRFVNNIFTCAPIHNLVHRRLLKPDGTSFSCPRAPEEARTEFLASSDSWFRPTSVRTGPDGALWIADMYRLVIEHAAYIDDHQKKTLDLRAGEDRGRIYRVVPIGTPLRKMQRLDDLSIPELVSRLDTANGWQRDTVHRLLLEAEDRRLVTHHLNHLLLTINRPLARLHALCVLDGLGSIETSHLLSALDDPHPGIRRHAIRIAESYLDRDPAILARLTDMSDDSDAQVVLQLASTLGQASGLSAARALGQILVDPRSDDNLIAAVLSSLNQSNVSDVLDVALSDGDANAQRLESRLTPVLEIAAAYGESTALLRAFQSAMPNHDVTDNDAIDALALRKLTRLVRVASRHDIPLNTSLDPASAQRLTKLVAALEQIVARPGVDADWQTAAVELLGWAPSKEPERREALLTMLLDPRYDPGVQRAAIAALYSTEDARVAKRVMARWPQLSPAIRSDLIDVLLTRKTWTTEILRRLEHGLLSVGELSPSHQQRLLLHDDATIQVKARELLKQSDQSSRQEVMQRYRDVLRMNGDKEQGRQLFAKHCSVCHRLQEVGHMVGPDLMAVTNRSPEALLTAILDPNRSIEDKYRTYLVHTTDGRVLTGILAAETSTSLTLAMNEGKRQVILRRDVEALVASSSSLMPEGLEKELSNDAMADLLAYLEDFGPPPKAFPGNKPQVINANSDGSLVLPVTASRIYGTTVVLEARYGNLGFWQSEDDRADWSIVVSKSGEYEVTLDYACDDSTDGNPFILQIGAEQITGKVAGTGTWEDYHERHIGSVHLSAGNQHAVFRSFGRVDNCLIDLRGVTLRPVVE